VIHITPQTAKSKSGATGVTIVFLIKVFSKLYDIKIYDTLYGSGIELKFFCE